MGGQRWWTRLVDALRRGRVQRDIDRELSFHVRERADQLQAEGVGRDDALRRARVQFGNPLLQRERTQDVHILQPVDAALRNLRHAVRALRRTPAFTATVVLTLAIGIGANTTIFSAIDAVLLRPLPFRDADRLVRLTQASDTSGEGAAAAVRIDDWGRLSTTFVAVAHFAVEDVADTTGSAPERLRRATVSPAFLDVMGVDPILGRGFTGREHRLGAADVVLISERYWRRQFNAAADVLERFVRIGDRAYSVVGVLPAAFAYPAEDVDWWVAQWIDAPWTQSRQLGYDGIGRLEPGVTLGQATADLERVQAQLAAEYPDTDAGIHPRVTPLKEVIVGPSRPSLWLLFGSVSILMLIACTNIAGLLLSRNAQRQDELAVRYVIGASRKAVGLQVLTESAVLALAGGVAGVAVAVALSGWLRRMGANLPRLDEIGLNGRVLLYTAVATTIVALLCGLAPILRGTSLRNPVVTGGRAQLAPRQRLQWLLVGVQVALSVALLVGAGLLGRSLDRFSRIDSGFVADRVLTFRISASFGEERDYNRTVQRINRTLDELAQLPGIEATATTGVLPGLAGNAAREFEILERRVDAAGRSAQFRLVSPSYFEVMQIPILEGELCRRPESAAGIEEVMVNRAWAERFVPGRSPIGMRLAAENPDRIAGIVGDARETGLEQVPVPVIYGCFSAPTPMQWFLARASGDPAAVVPAIRARLRQIEPLRSLYEAVPLERRIELAYAQNRVRTIVLALFAATALSLACLGVYGTVSYTASLRRREVGLRVALGASQFAILRQIVSTGGLVVGAATMIGLLMSLLVGRVLSSMLYEIAPADPPTLGGVIVLVLAVGLGAAFVPAIRAASADPARVLRNDAS